MIWGAVLALIGGTAWTLGMRRAKSPVLWIALAIALLGYAWQGRPDVPGAPAARRAMPPVTGAGLIDSGMVNTFGPQGAWLTLADALVRQRKTEGAVLAMRSALSTDRRNADLWVGLGYTLVAHADGLVTMPAVLAFRQAQKYEPDAPGAAFFLALRRSQTGEAAAARAMLTRLIRTAPTDAPYRALAERRLAELR